VLRDDDEFRYIYVGYWWNLFNFNTCRVRCFMMVEIEAKAQMFAEEERLYVLKVWGVKG